MPEEGKRSGPSSDPVLSALEVLCAEMASLRAKVEAAVKEGGPISMLANELLHRRQTTEDGPTLEERLEKLEAKARLQTVTRIEVAVLVLGAIASIFNAYGVLRLVMAH